MLVLQSDSVVGAATCVARIVNQRNAEDAQGGLAVETVRENSSRKMMGDGGSSGIAERRFVACGPALSLLTVAETPSPLQLDFSNKTYAPACCKVCTLPEWRLLQPGSKTKRTPPSCRCVANRSRLLPLRHSLFRRMAVPLIAQSCRTQRPPAFPFQRIMRVLHQQQQQTSRLCFRFLSPCSPMSYPTFWSDACRHAMGRPLQARLDALNASCGVTVRRPPLLPLGARPAHACVAGFHVCL